MWAAVVAVQGKLSARLDAPVAARILECHGDRLTPAERQFVTAVIANPDDANLRALACLDQIATASRPCDRHGVVSHSCWSPLPGELLMTYGCGKGQFVGSELVGRAVGE